MNHIITLASTGTPVTYGQTVQAVRGPYAGSWWRLDDVVRVNGAWRVCASRSHRVGRHKVVCLPDVFDLAIEEIVKALRHVANTLVILRRKVDDGIFLGFLALIPLALFEAFHGGEVTRHLLESMFNSHANTGGGH